MIATYVEADGAHRRWVLGGEPHVFHCHHYNTFLLQSILDAEYVDSAPFLIGAGQEVAHAQFTALFRRVGSPDVPTRKALCEEVYRWAGFGAIDLRHLGADGGEVVSADSHYGFAWQQKCGRAAAPVDYFTTGWLAGAAAAVFDRPAAAYGARQVQCVAAGHPQTAYRIGVGEPSYRPFTSPGLGPLGEPPSTLHASPAVDAEGVYRAVAGLPFAPDRHGFIPAFGVYLTRHYANYYNRVSFEFLRALEAGYGEEGAQIARSLLVEAGHVCAFNTFGGIMTSTEWDALIRPSLASPEDWVYGIVAVINALGWGRWQVVNPREEEATFVLHDDYESVGHLAAYGPATRSVSFLAEGAVMGIMNLVYRGEVHTKPQFDEAFYDRMFRADDTYQADVRSARAMGAPSTVLRVFRP